MKLLKLLATAAACTMASNAVADLEPFKDYDISETITNVTTVKVDSNMIDKYLEGLRDTWLPSNKIAQDLGYIEDHWISVSELPNSGDFNVVLGVVFKDASALQPSEEQYDAFMKEWGEAMQEKSEAIVQTYPDIRTIVGEYYMREITLK